MTIAEIISLSYGVGFFITLFIADRVVNVPGLTRNSVQDYLLVLLLAAVWPLLIVWLISLGVGAIPQLVYSAITYSIKFTLFLKEKTWKNTESQTETYWSRFSRKSRRS